MTTQYQDLWINSFLSPFGLEKFKELIPESFKNFDTFISSWQEAYETGVFANPSSLFTPGTITMKDMQGTISGYFKLAGLVPLNEHLAVLERADNLQKEHQTKEMDEKEIEEKFLELNNLIQKHHKTAESRKKELSKQKTVIETQKKELKEQKALIETQKKELKEQKALIETQKKELNEQNTLIGAQKKELADQKAVIETQKKDLDKKDSAIKDLSAADKKAATQKE